MCLQIFTFAPMKKIVFKIITLIIGLTLVSCTMNHKQSFKTKTVDFSVKDIPGTKNNSPDSIPVLNVAVSAIISPRQTFNYYKELFAYISGKIHHRIEFKQRRTYQEVNNLIHNREVDLAFVCSGAYIEEKELGDVDILVVPLCNGKPFYQAYIITNKSSDINSFEDLRGKSFAFTDPLSNTGKLYADKRLADFHSSPDSFFSSIVYTHAHDISMQLVSKKVVDGATVDGLIYDYMAKFHPERVKNLKIIEKSEYFGIPPVVIPSGLNDKLKEQLKDVFLSIHKDPAGKRILNKLLIDRFIIGDDSNYNNIRQIKRKISR